jgi:hypothetical protein
LLIFVLDEEVALNEIAHTAQAAKMALNWQIIPPRQRVVKRHCARGQEKSRRCAGF